MILLSSLLGPAKPPVASQSDLSTAGGLYRLVVTGGSLVAESVDSAAAPIELPEGERCLICLSDYEEAEELRQLNKCKHLYHRECIDQVSPSVYSVHEKLSLTFFQVVDNGTKLMSIM